VQRPEIDLAIIEELMKGYERPADLTGPGGIMEELHKRLYERVLGANWRITWAMRKVKRPSRRKVSVGKTTAMAAARRRWSARMEGKLARIFHNPSR
jgi:hypothetical protein